ncbi:MAG: DUF1775 domain-containing protein [Verrucomicrobiota bacterium]
MSAPRRSIVLCALLVAFALPSLARAHVTLAPHQLAPGAERLLVFSAPDERDRVAITALTITLSPGFVVGSVEATPGWTASAGTRTVGWRGGRIPPNQFAQLAVRVVAPDRTGSFTVEAVEHFADGRSSTFHPRLTVRPPAAVRAEPGRDSGARTLGKFALGAGLIGIVLAVAVGFLALRNWLSLPDPREETEYPEAAKWEPTRMPPSR